MQIVNTYDLFSGDELKIAEKIQQRRLQILVHSCIYYELNGSSISDRDWDRFAKELVALQHDYPSIAEKLVFAAEFADFDGTTGFNLPMKDEWVVMKAHQLCKEVKRGNKK